MMPFVLKVIGSTGFRTFLDPKGDLHETLCNIAEALPAMLGVVGEKSGLPKEKNATGCHRQAAFFRQVGKNRRAK
jgi:hypothetical protein